MSHIEIIRCFITFVSVYVQAHISTILDIVAYRTFRPIFAVSVEFTIKAIFWVSECVFWCFDRIWCICVVHIWCATPINLQNVQFQHIWAGSTLLKWICAIFRCIFNVPHRWVLCTFGTFCVFGVDLEWIWAYLVCFANSRPIYIGCACIAHLVAPRGTTFRSMWPRLHPFFVYDSVHKCHICMVHTRPQTITFRSMDRFMYNMCVCTKCICVFMCMYCIWFSPLVSDLVIFGVLFWCI